MKLNDNHLLILIGVFIVALVATEMLPMQQPAQSAPATATDTPALPKPPKISSGAVTSVNIMFPQVALVTLSVVP